MHVAQTTLQCGQFYNNLHRCRCVYKKSKIGKCEISIPVITKNILISYPFQDYVLLSMETKRIPLKRKLPVRKLINALVEFYLISGYTSLWLWLVYILLILTKIFIHACNFWVFRSWWWSRINSWCSTIRIYVLLFPRQLWSWLVIVKYCIHGILEILGSCRNISLSHRSNNKCYKIT